MLCVVDVWWKGLKKNVVAFCRSCLVSASRKGGHKTFKLPLVPIPVGGLFHRVAVDILQVPNITQGNCYVVVFMDFLTKWPDAFARRQPEPYQLIKALSQDRGVNCKINSKVSCIHSHCGITYAYSFTFAVSIIMLGLSDPEFCPCFSFSNDLEIQVLLTNFFMSSYLTT